MIKYYKIIVLAIIMITSVALLGCRIIPDNGSAAEDNTIEESEPEKSAPEELESEIPDKVTEDEKNEDSEDPVIDQDIEGSLDEEKLADTLLGFFNAVKQDNEYEYFSSQTIGIVGSEEEYKNGDKSDIYFIIQESHSSWENIEFENIIITDNTAIVEIMGDRMAEGTKYEDEKIVFDFIKENDEWKIDFSF